MKRGILSTAVVLLAATTAMAQPPAAGGGRREGGLRIPGVRMMDRPLTLSQVPPATMKAVFKLSDEQVRKIEAIRSKTMEGLRALMPQRQQGQRPDPRTFEAIRPKIDAAIKKADGEIMAVLTPAQRKQVPAMLKEMQALRNSGLPMSLAGSLKLTPDQIKKLDAIGKERAAALTKLFQQSNQDRMAVMQKMGQIREDARKNALAVLNAQQKAAVDKWEKEHPRRGFMGGPGAMPGGPGMGRAGAGPGAGSSVRPGRPGGSSGPAGPGGRRP